jgi:elongation factor 3
MEARIGKIFADWSKVNKVSIDSSEVEYVCGSVETAIEDRMKVACSKKVLDEFRAELMDIVCAMIPVDEVSGGVLSDLILDFCSLVYPECRSILNPSLDNTLNGVSPVLDLEDVSLAYMGLELLRHTDLRLYPGKVYGLLGQNGVGKTTLLGKMAAGEVPGMPSSVRTAIVGHELVGEELKTVREIIGHNDAILPLLGFSGSNSHLLDIHSGQLSGGWKMKVALGKILGSAAPPDVLLLDEPTNHLDRATVDWLSGFLRTLSKTAVVIVSHDKKFLDATIDFVIHFSDFTLRTVQSGFTEFILREKLDPMTLAPLGKPRMISHPFHLPKPGPLDGIRSNTQTIAKLENVYFEYGSGHNFGVQNISGRITLSSRIALIGPNGAGKSTIVNLLVGRIAPMSGTVYRHPNLRIAYVSQHHIHHLEEFLGKTCLEYFVDRFGSGFDKEVFSLDSLEESKYEQMDRVAKMRKYFEKFPKSRAGRGGVKSLVGRRKSGKSFEYEILWEGYREDQTDWIDREVLETQLGLGKLCSQLDAVIAQKKAQTDQRALDFTSIKKYLSEFGVLPHTAEGKIEGLSGGQKTRLTLAAAVWQHPHMIILDEPTNYLDIPSLESLIAALTDFNGAVVLISHNAAFVDKFATEKWAIEGGKKIDE